MYTKILNARILFCILSPVGVQDGHLALPDAIRCVANACEVFSFYYLRCFFKYFHSLPFRAFC